MPEGVFVRDERMATDAEAAKRFYGAVPRLEAARGRPEQDPSRIHPG
jgi:hypothetical protein